MSLCNASLDVLSSDDPEQQAALLAAYKDMPHALQTLPAVTCMEARRPALAASAPIGFSSPQVLRQAMDEPTAVSMLVVGTETRQVYILNPAVDKILQKVIEYLPNKTYRYPSCVLYRSSWAACLHSCPVWVCMTLSTE